MSGERFTTKCHRQKAVLRNTRPPQLSPVQHVHATLSLIRSSRCTVAPAALQPLFLLPDSSRPETSLIKALVSSQTAVLLDSAAACPLLGRRACSGTAAQNSVVPGLPGLPRPRWGSELTSLSNLKRLVMKRVPEAGALWHGNDCYLKMQHCSEDCSPVLLSIHTFSCSCSHFWQPLPAHLSVRSSLPSSNPCMPSPS